MLPWMNEIFEKTSDLDLNDLSKSLINHLLGVLLELEAINHISNTLLSSSRYKRTLI